jgi:hypothetical protein
MVAMCDEKADKPTEEKLEELRKWFEAVGDCV